MFPVVRNVEGNLLITGDLVVSEMELSFILRLDNVRAIETMLYDSASRRYVAINQEKLTGSELVQALQAYIEEYNSPIKGRLTRETMLPGDLLYDADTGSFCSSPSTPRSRSRSRTTPSTSRCSARTRPPRRSSTAPRCSFTSPPPRGT